MKCMKLIAVSLIAAGLCMGCSDGGDRIPDAPVVNLPESKGENPFKGMTFWEDRYEKYVFSDDGKTVTCYDRDDDETDKFVPWRQYRYSIDADKRELSWAVEKVSTYDKLYTFDEFVRYVNSGKYSEDCKAELEAELKAGEITQEKFDKKVAEIPEMIDWISENDFFVVRIEFSGRQRFKYTYNELEGTLDLSEQFEESSAYFYYRRSYENSSGELYIERAGVGLQTSYASIEFGGNDYPSGREFYARPFSSSEKKITFENEDDENDTFTATYELKGSGNDTIITLSFTYDDHEFHQTLAFRPEGFSLTETQPE